MLYQIGPVTMDTRPFNVDDMSRTSGGSYAEKPLISALAGQELTGEEETITLSGQLLPSKIGGLTEVEALVGLSRSGSPVPVMRGDGKMFGWFIVKPIAEQHSNLMRDGVGFVVKYSVPLVKTGPEGASPNIIGSLLSLFDAMGA